MAYVPDEWVFETGWKHGKLNLNVGISLDLFTTFITKFFWDAALMRASSIVYERQLQLDFHQQCMQVRQAQEEKETEIVVKQAQRAALEALGPEAVAKHEAQVELHLAAVKKEKKKDKKKKEKENVKLLTFEIKQLQTKLNALGTSSEEEYNALQTTLMEKTNELSKLNIEKKKLDK